MTDAAIEAVLRRDRLIVAVALALMTALAWAYVWWLATDMDMGGMDMSGFRMIPCRQRLDDAEHCALDRNGVRLRVRHVGGDDDRHDDAVGDAHDSHLCAPRSSGRPGGGTFAGERLFCR